MTAESEHVRNSGWRRQRIVRVRHGRSTGDADQAVRELPVEVAEKIQIPVQRDSGTGSEVGIRAHGEDALRSVVLEIERILDEPVNGGRTPLGFPTVTAVSG